MRMLFCNKTVIFRVFAGSIWLFVLALCLCGCARQYTDLATAQEEGKRIAGGVAIDGVAVGGMTVQQAKELLEKEHIELEAQTHYSFRLRKENVGFSAEELPTAWNTDEVLLKAVNLSPLSGEKELFCKMSLNAEECRAYLEKLTEPLALEPQNAKLTYKKGAFNYEKEKDGERVDVSAMVRNMTTLPSGETHRLDAVLLNEKAKYTEADAKKDSALIASFQTSFAKGNYGVKNRVHNIKKAAGLIDGYKIEVGETFDMNAVLGDRNGENGWREATAIREGSYVQEYGGGVCQVSTTLYNAALMADLKITERRPHSWPLGYVDIGRDATISTGGPNLCFVNTTEAPVYISALTDTEEKTISVALYGRKRVDGMNIRIRSEKVESIEDPGDEIRIDKSLSAGERTRVRESREGSVSETYKQYYSSDGILVREELVGRDKYRAIKGIVLVSGKKTEAQSALKIYG